MVAELGTSKHQPNDRRAIRFGVPIVLFTAAAIGWWWSLRMVDDMRADEMAGMDMSTTALGSVGFVVAWLAMMAAMMLPTVAPVSKLYLRAVPRGRVAPFPYFVVGYLAVWMIPAFPGYLAWRALAAPIAAGADWAGRLAGGVFLIAGLWQLTPLKKRCLQHCRSPMSFFMRFGRNIEKPIGAARMGAYHGLFCGGCCWAMFALLTAIGTMNIGWMLLLTALIASEKTLAKGELIAVIAGGLALVFGVVLFASPSIMNTIT
jgi:predicted metal-binding membrane protein